MEGVLADKDLLYCILQWLPPDDLCRCMRQNKLWKTVAGSDRVWNRHIVRIMHFFPQIHYTALRGYQLFNSLLKTDFTFTGPLPLLQKLCHLITCIYKAQLPVKYRNKLRLAVDYHELKRDVGRISIIKPSLVLITGGRKHLEPIIWQNKVERMWVLDFFYNVLLENPVEYTLHIIGDQYMDAKRLKI